MKLDWKNDYDWKEAFGFAGTIRSVVGNIDGSGFSIDDVAHVECSEEGENDGPSWIMYGQLKDGRWFFLDAWCDYTGWDCQSGGDAQLADTKENLIRFGMTEDARDRFGLSIGGTSCQC